MHVKYRKILYNLANISSLHELYGTILMEYFFFHTNYSFIRVLLALLGITSVVHGKE